MLYANGSFQRSGGLNQAMDLRTLNTHFGRYILKLYLVGRPLPVEDSSIPLFRFMQLESFCVLHSPYPAPRMANTPQCDQVACETFLGDVRIVVLAIKHRHIVFERQSLGEAP